MIGVWHDSNCKHVWLPNEWGSTWYYVSLCDPTTRVPKDEVDQHGGEHICGLCQRLVKQIAKDAETMKKGR